MVYDTIKLRRKLALIYRVTKQESQQSLEIFTILMLLSTALLFGSAVLCLWPTLRLLILPMAAFPERRLGFTDGASRIFASDSTVVAMRPASFKDAPTKPRGRRVSAEDDASIVSVRSKVYWSVPELADVV